MKPMLPNAQPPIRLEIREGLARLTLTCPGRGNPIDAAFCAAFSEFADQLSENRAVRCVLLAAEGEAFSYGGDVSALVADLNGLPLNVKRWTALLHSAVVRLQRMDAPLVAAVQGVCAGGMAAIVAGWDFLVAAKDARFVAAYPGIGFSCDAGASVMFARRMGMTRARRFLLFNETLSAAAALRAGLVDEVVDPDDLLDRALEAAKQLASGPTLALGAIRRLLLTASEQPLEAQLELEAQALARIASTRDARIGLQAFANKATPRFSGQ
jgi:2-(1,2-epoxy-1,2-dihydrophenyl)acetyl-CoA isomerase